MRAGCSLHCCRRWQTCFSSPGAVRWDVVRDGWDVRTIPLALCPPAQPLVGRGPGNTHLGSDTGDGTTRPDTLDEQPPAVNGQPGIIVGNEEPPCGAVLDSSTTLEVFPMIKPRGCQHRS